MIVQTARFGALEVAEHELLSFPQGIPGFEGEKQFVFKPFAADSPFAYLHSATNPHLTFVITEPFAFFPDYQFQLDEAFGKEFGITLANPPQIFSIVTIPEKASEVTANLLGPLLINWRDKIAVQYVLVRSEYTTRHLLFPKGLPQVPAGEAK